MGDGVALPRLDVWMLTVGNSAERGERFAVGAVEITTTSSSR